MLDTYVIFDKVEAWQLEPGDLIMLDDEYVIVEELLDSDDNQTTLVVVSSLEDGEKTTHPLFWSSDVHLWRIDDD